MTRDQSIGWDFEYDVYSPEQEGLREALCTLGNGYFATRGAFADASADGTHYPGTYVAGLYNRLEKPIQDRLVEDAGLVNLTRSEERRVGEECVSALKTQGSTAH